MSKTVWMIRSRIAASSKNRPNAAASSSTSGMNERIAKKLICAAERWPRSSTNSRHARLRRVDGARGDLAELGAAHASTMPARGPSLTRRPATTARPSRRPPAAAHRAQRDGDAPHGLVVVLGLERARTTAACSCARTARPGPRRRAETRRPRAAPRRRARARRPGRSSVTQVLWPPAGTVHVASWPRWRSSARSSESRRRGRPGSPARAAAGGGRREVARGEVLGQRRGVDVGVELELHEAAEDRAARRDPADAQPAADRLRERVDVDDVRRRLLAQARQRGAVVADRRVDAVLEDEEAARARELDEALAAPRREVGAGRVRARRLQRDELDLVAREDPLERVDVRALVVDRQRQHARAGRLQRAEDAGERRRLDDGDVAGVRSRAGDEVDRLARAGGDEDLVGGCRVARVAAELGEALAQRGEALDLEVARDGARRTRGRCRRRSARAPADGHSSGSGKPEPSESVSPASGACSESRIISSA